MTERRASQRDWYYNRGRVRENIACEGTGLLPEVISQSGNYKFQGQYNKPAGEMPRGICRECKDEIALNPKPNVDIREFTVRKHKNPTAPYRRQMLITEANYNKIMGKAEAEDVNPDEYLNNLIERAMPSRTSSPEIV